MTGSKVGLAVVVLLGSLACGGGDDNLSVDGAPGGGGPGVDLGEATLTIGTQVWEFDSFACAFGHAATQSDVFSFSSSSFGEHSTGTRVQMQADIEDPDTQGRFEGEGVIYTVYVTDIEDFETPEVDFESRNKAFGLTPSGMTVVSINGDIVTATGLFDDRITEDDFTQTEGTLDARCGDQSRR